MPILNELSDAVRRQRIEMGLSQQRLGELAGLSNAIVDRLESGQLTELDVISAERLANTLGLGLGVTGIRKAIAERDIADALETAARSGSISYRDTMPVEALCRALLTGETPLNYTPQLRAMLDESPLRVLSAAVAQMEAEHGVPRGTTWQKMRQLATSLACTRSIWW